MEFDWHGVQHESDESQQESNPLQSETLCGSHGLEEKWKTDDQAFM